MERVSRVQHRRLAAEGREPARKHPLLRGDDVEGEKATGADTRQHEQQVPNRPPPPGDFLRGDRHRIHPLRLPGVRLPLGYSGHELPHFPAQRENPQRQRPPAERRAQVGVGVGEREDRERGVGHRLGENGPDGGARAKQCDDLAAGEHRADADVADGAKEERTHRAARPSFLPGISFARHRYHAAAVRCGRQRSPRRARYFGLGNLPPPKKRA